MSINDPLAFPAHWSRNRGRWRVVRCSFHGPAEHIEVKIADQLTLLLLGQLSTVVASPGMIRSLNSLEVPNWFWMAEIAAGETQFTHPVANASGIPGRP